MKSIWETLQVGFYIRVRFNTWRIDFCSRVVESVHD